jgi:hypothetical protein
MHAAQGMSLSGVEPFPGEVRKRMEDPRDIVGLTQADADHGASKISQRQSKSECDLWRSQLVCGRLFVLPMIDQSSALSALGQ